LGPGNLLRCGHLHTACTNLQLPPGNVLAHLNSTLSETRWVVGCVFDQLEVCCSAAAGPMCGAIRTRASAAQLLFYIPSRRSTPATPSQAAARPGGFQAAFKFFWNLYNPDLPGGTVLVSAPSLLSLLPVRIAGACCARAGVAAEAPQDKAPGPVARKGPQGLGKCKCHSHFQRALSGLAAPCVPGRGHNKDDVGVEPLAPLILAQHSKIGAPASTS
jgi:hypothetical protein